MPSYRLKELLNTHEIEYECIQSTAIETVENTHFPLHTVAKTVIIRVDGKMAMAVLPADYLVDLLLLRRVTACTEIEIVHEKDFLNHFPECELGAMPPFGNLYDMEVYASERLADNEFIMFNAGTHTEVIRLRYYDFDMLVQPKVAMFSSYY